MDKQFLEQHDLVIFDLDGTLYEGTEHFKLHTENLKANLSSDEQQQFDEHYNNILAGNHPVQIGKIYDGIHDLIWTWDPFTEQLTEARDWNNQVVKIDDAPNKIKASDFDFVNWVPIGDGWWPPYAIARHFGITVDTIQASYNKTKEQMAELDGFLNQTAGLKEYLESIYQDHTLIVCTNSDEEDAKRLLEFLELDKYFVELISWARKPVYTKQHFEDVLNRYNINPERVLSVGDNFMNEIAPALQLGMSAMWLTDAKVKPVDDDRLVLVETLSDQ
ncbi:HAD family hydrolase [Alkalibacillus haloalkaliphilus]|uniref:HAD family hydrolase n=1 Tax=Alkalibacillus haloalkaliphilus TaxID=94136 RepID=UPI0002E198F4|nr:HAD family hydrolase [Alkalibacillus haloalkaliphilus]